MTLSLQLLLSAVVVFAQLEPPTPVHSLSTDLRNPAGIEVLDTGAVLVADLSHDHIARFDAAGAAIGIWVVPEGPIDVAADTPVTRYYVSLRDSGTVAVYDAAFVRTGFLGEGNPLVGFVRPTDIDVATDTGIVYVVDAGGDTVYGFFPDGTLALKFGLRGSLNSEFLYPSAIAVDEANARLVVADQDNFRVQVFTLDGIFVRRFGYRIKYLPGAPEEGWMPRTQGLAVDTAGRIYVADSMMNTVRVFTPDGAELGKLLSYGPPPAGVRAPYGLALNTAETRLYVACSGTATVEVYSTPTFALPLAASRRVVVPKDGAAGVPGRNWSGYDAMRIGAGFPLSPLEVLPSPAKQRGTRSAGASDKSVTANAAAVSSGYDGPHMPPDAPIVCGRCHGIDAQPGNHPGVLEGQVVVCASCHLGDGVGLTDPVAGPPDADPYAVNTNSGTGPGRSHAWGVPAVNAAMGSVGPPAGSEMELYLEGGNIKCATCHNQHNSDAGSPYLRANNDNGAMCRLCHVDHIGHTPAGPWQPTCEDCHAVHHLTSENLSLISPIVRNQTLAIDKAVVLTATTGPNSFSDGDATNDGICQVCHTVTNYHRHDGTGTPHHEGQNCIGCHPHEAGFVPAGGSCTGCHSGAQDNGDGVPVGGRRAIVGEFPTGDTHAHYGAELDEAACVVCHDQTTHMDGHVDLIDADTGAIYVFVRPGQNESGPGDISDFCQSCHDADGATRLATPTDPFGNGNAPFDVVAKLSGTLQWDQQYGGFCFDPEGTLRAVNSHHDINDADQIFSGAKIECLNCHGAHAAGATQPRSDPADTTVPWTGTPNDFCLACHAGGTGPADLMMPNPPYATPVIAPVIDTTDPRWESLDVNWCEIGGGICEVTNCSSLRGIESNDYVEQPWYMDYNWTHSVHGKQSKRPWNGYSEATSYDMNCTDCHDPHGSATPANPAGNPYMIKDFVDGTAFVDDGARPLGFNGPPFATFGVARSVQVSAEGTTVGWGDPTGLCGVCHGDWLAAYDFHSYCTGCQTCHGHGAAWNEADWVDFNSDEPIPHNDVCGRGAAVAANDASLVWDNGLAVDDVAPLCDVTAPSHGLWFKVAGTGTTLTATTCLPGTTFDTSMQVFCDCETLGCVAGNDDDVTCALDATRSTVSWCSDVNQIYYLHVGGAGAAFGAFELAITDDAVACASPPGCAPDIGACCVGATLAANNTFTECNALGGDWYLGEECDTFECPSVGACCVLGVCEATNTNARCATLGGVWTNGEDCATYSCAPPPPITTGVKTAPEPQRGETKPVRRAPAEEGGRSLPLHRIAGDR